MSCSFFMANVFNFHTQAHYDQHRVRNSKCHFKGVQYNPDSNSNVLLKCTFQILVEAFVLFKICNGCFIVIVSRICNDNNTIKDNKIAVHKVTDYDSSKQAIF